LGFPGRRNGDEFHPSVVAQEEPAVVSRFVAAVEIDMQERWDMGIVGMVAVQRALTRLSETYVAPVERDYWVY
jgi:hypothetical protein